MITAGGGVMGAGFAQDILEANDLTCVLWIEHKSIDLDRMIVN